MSYDKPTVAEFKTFFARDFFYDADPTKGVTDGDIQRAMLEGEFTTNLSFCDSQQMYTMWYLYAAAHFLVTDLRASTAGINGSYTWLTQSKSVGSVSESFAIPQKILDNPRYAMWTKTNYGAKLLHMMLPYLVAPIFTVFGRTNP